MKSIAIVALTLCLSLMSGLNCSRAQPQRKLVFAHYMVCCPRGAMDALGAYKGPTVDEFLAEIREAHGVGIDGFALNCGEWDGHPRYKANSAMLFEAARRFGPDFKLFFSADGITADEAADMVNTYGNHPNQLRYGGHPVLSSFGGNDEWAQAIRARIRERGGGEAFLVPFFYPRDFRPIRTAADVQSLLDDNKDIDGYFYFGAGGTPDFLAGVIRLNAEEWPRHGKLFMAGIAAYYRGLRNNFIVFESNGYESLVKQWLAAIETDTQWVELVTWNDWSEDTYLQSLSPAGAKSRWMDVWGDLLSHDGFREANRYFIDWFKSGRRPPIERERIFYAYRIHRKYALGHPFPGEPQLAMPGGAQALIDRVHILAFLQRPAELTVHLGAQSERVDMSAGMSLASVPMRTGDVSFDFVRDGEVVAAKKGEFPISATDGWGNFNILADELPIDKHGSTPRSD